MSANATKSKTTQPLSVTPNTTLLLLVQYGGTAIVPLEAVVRDYFSHLTVEKFLRKVLAGKIALPVTRVENSQKAARGIHVIDLARYLDEQRARAIKECEQLRAEPA